MSQYKFYYFDSRGLAEPIRQILSYSGTPFEDIRLPLGGLTPEKKEELGLEWGQVPLLEIDGVKKTQMYAICRYLAKKFNIAGKTEAEQFRCEEIVEAVRDYFQKAYLLYAGIADPTKLEGLKKTFIEVDNPVHLKRFNNILEKHGNTWLVGDSLTYADIILVHVITQFMTVFDLESTKDFPALTKLINSVQNHPNLKDWFENRPKTKY